MAAAQLGHAGAYTRLLTEVDAGYALLCSPSAGSMVEDTAQDTLLTLQPPNTYEPGRPSRHACRTRTTNGSTGYVRWTVTRCILAEDISEDIPIDDHGPAIVSALPASQTFGASLKPAQSEVIRLVKLDGLSVEEASETHRPVRPLVKVNIHRACYAQLHRSRRD